MAPGPALALPLHCHMAAAPLPAPSNGDGGRSACGAAVKSKDLHPGPHSGDGSGRAHHGPQTLGPESRAESSSRSPPFLSGQPCASLPDLGRQLAEIQEPWGWRLPSHRPATQCTAPREHRASSCPRTPGPRPRRHRAHHHNRVTTTGTSAHRALTCQTKAKTMSRFGETLRAGQVRSASLWRTPPAES